MFRFNFIRSTLVITDLLPEDLRAYVHSDSKTNFLVMLSWPPRRLRLSNRSTSTS